MAPRKTIPVQGLKIVVNSMLEKSIDEARHERSGMAAVLERVLMDTDNYKGFQYLDSEFETEPTADDNGVPYRRLRDGFDQTRRRYY